jgi:hypothetical protein
MHVPPSQPCEPASVPKGGGRQTTQLSYIGFPKGFPPPLVSQIGVAPEHFVLSTHSTQFPFESQTVAPPSVH